MCKNCAFVFERTFEVKVHPESKLHEEQVNHLCYSELARSSHFPWANMRRAKSGTRLGKYLVGKKIGEGGFGVVRCAIHEDTGNRVAIKILDKAQLQMMHMTPQVRKEISLLTSLRHPNIVSGVEVLSSSSRLFLIMEYVNGGDMHTLITKKKRLSLKESRFYFRSLMKAMHYCHSRGVYHRDLKLENLLLTKDGNLKVCDFGLASVKGKSGENSYLCNTIVGTEDFTAPEIILGQCYSGSKADMWSSGVVLFAIVAGFLPFQGSTTRGIHEDVVNVRYTFPKNFPEEARDVISKLLVLDPKKRPSAESVLKMPWIHEEGDDNDEIERAENIEEEQENIDQQPPKHRSKEDLKVNSAIQAAPREEGRKTSDETIKSNLSFMSAAKLIPDFPIIYAAMRDPQSGIHVQNRRWRFRRFPKCFIGTEAVSWLAEYSKVSRHEAVRFGQEMINAGVFHHVCREHGLKDDYLFYRFQEDDPANFRVLNIRQIWSQSLETREPVQVSFELLSRMIGICKNHQSESSLVDITGVQQDKDYLMLRNATAELQTAHLEHISDEEKMAFVVNCHNLLCMHARIQLGEVERTSLTSFNTSLNKFKYEIGGVHLCLNDLKNLLVFNRRKSSKSSVSDVVSPLAIRSLSMPSSPQAKVWKLFGSGHSDLHHADDMVGMAPTLCSPYAFFALSDGSPGSPAIEAVMEKDMSAIGLTKIAHRHVEMHVGNVRIGKPGSKNLTVFCLFLDAAVGFDHEHNSKELVEWIDTIISNQPGSQSDKFNLVQDLEIRPLLTGKRVGDVSRSSSTVFSPVLCLPESDFK